MNALAKVMLTNVERELLRAFRNTDARGKRSILFFAEGEADDWPAQRPKLTLVQNCGPKAQSQRSKAKG